MADWREFAERCSYEVGENSIQSAINRYIRSFEFSLSNDTKAMQLTKFPVVIVLLTARACLAKIIVETSKPNESVSKLVEDVVSIVTTCYEDRIDGIGLAGNLPDALSRTLSVQHLIPVVLINNTYQYTDHRVVATVEFLHKLHFFIVEASYIKQLDSLIYTNIAASKWWNQMASFFILDMSPGCDNSYVYLDLAWFRNLLNAKVLCHGGEGGTIIFNSNPFTSRAPISWEQFKIFPSLNKHPFTVFSRPYRGNKSICVDLDFEKTNNLGGYPIRVEEFRRRNLPAKSARGHHRFWSEIDRFFDIFSDTLKATLRYSDNGRFPIPQSEDIRKRPAWVNFAWNEYMTTYPYKQLGYGIVSQFRGHKSQLNKILSVIDTNSWFGMGIVYLITYSFFKFFVGQALVPAFLNLVRITCNTGFMNLPGNNAGRIYLGCLLFFVVTMQGIFQGNLAALLTTSVPVQDVNTIQHIVDFGYKEICYTENSIAAIDYHVLKNHFITIKKSSTIEDCLAKVRDDSSTVYFGFIDGVTLDLALDYKLHISYPPIKMIYMAFNIRWHWPLEERANIIIQTFVESDIFEAWEVKCDPIKFINYEFDEMVIDNQEFKIIELGELAFAFAILGIGLACATATFIIELAVKYKCKCRCELVIVKL